MITKITAVNFKCHVNTDIEPGRVTALVGPNGSGKSSLLQAILMLSQLASRSLGDVFVQALKSGNIIRRGQSDIGFTLAGIDPVLNLKDGEGVWRLHVDLYRENLYKEWEPKLYWKLGNRENLKADFFDFTFAEPGKTIVEKNIGSVALFKAAPANLMMPSYSEDIPPFLTSDGQGLASAIAYLMTYEKSRFQEIEESIKRIIPFVTQLRVRPARVYREETRILQYDKAVLPINEQQGYVGHELIFDTTSAAEVPAGFMSDGTILVIGLLSMIHSSQNYQLILIDDIDHGLHPLAQRQLMQVLKDFAEKHNRQIILTSHSPYIVDELEAKDVWVMALDKEGISHVKQLSQHVDAERILEVLTTGEFVSAVGEDWVLETPATLEEVHG